MSVFFPSDPSDRHRTEIEAREWRKEQEKNRKRERRNVVMGWITTISAVIAALAAVAGVLIQLLSGR